MEEEFKEYVGGNLKDFTVLDAFDSLFLNGKANQEAQNPSKYLLYQDPMAGTFDREVVESGVGTGAYYPVYLLDLFFCYFTEKHLFILA